MATLAQQSYTPKKFDLAGLQGISDNTLQVHFGLYEGYVKNTNLLNEQIAGLIAEGKAAGANPGFAELTRRLGFEYNGMVLHEYYFGNMTKNAGAKPSAAVQDALAGMYGDFDTWKKDFSAVGGMRFVRPTPANNQLFASHFCNTRSTAASTAARASHLSRPFAKSSSYFVSQCRM